MTIIEYKFDSSPAGLMKRLERKNRKSDLSRIIVGIRQIILTGDMADSEKIQKISEKIDLSIIGSI